MFKHVDGMVEDLATVDLFSTCTRKELRAIAGLCTPTTVQPGFVLTTQGGTGLECFVVVSGTGTVTVDGQEIASVGPGDCVGEMALLDHGRRSATVTAATTMDLYVLTGAEFRTMIEANIEIIRKIAVHLSERLRTRERA